MLLRVPSLIEFGSHCLQTSGCTGGFIEFSMKCCSPNAVKGKQPTSEEPCVTGSCYPEMECLPHSLRAPNSSSGQTRQALNVTPDPLPTTPKLGLLSQSLALLSPQLTYSLKNLDTPSQTEPPSPFSSPPHLLGPWFKALCAAVAECLLPAALSLTCPKS